MFPRNHLQSSFHGILYMYSGSYSHILVKLFQHLILICAGGDVTGLQAELERLASLAGASPDNKVPSIMIIETILMFVPRPMMVT